MTKQDKILKYLPYEPKALVVEDYILPSMFTQNGIETLKTIRDVMNHSYNCKLFLKPMSDLLLDKYDFIFESSRDKEFIQGIISANNIPNYKILSQVSYSQVEVLFKWHFDVFNMIESGEAIDINTLSND